MFSHVDFIIAINSCSKRIKELNFSIQYGNYGVQYIEQLKKLLKRKEEELDLLTRLRDLYYEKND